MDRVVELITSFPTVVFTTLLACCLVWWIVSLLVSGVDGDIDIDADVDAGLDVDGGDAGPGEHPGVMSWLGFGTVPLSLGATILTFGAWAVSLLAALATDGLDGAIAVLIGIVVLVVAFVAGAFLLRAVSKPAARLFDFDQAPERTDSVGSTCRIRTLHADDTTGDAEVLSGPTKGSLIRVRTTGGRFERGEVCLVVDYDDATGRFTVSDLDQELRP